MKIFRGWCSNKNQPITNPFPEKNGFYFALHGGDVAHPISPGNWFKEPFFKKCWRWYCKWPLLPFLSWRFGEQNGYIGFKPWGMDEENPESGIYKIFRHWLNENDVYPGSRALHFSIRNGLTIAVPLTIGILLWMNYKDFYGFFN